MAAHAERGQGAHAAAGAAAFKWTRLHYMYRNVDPAAAITPGLGIVHSTVSTAPSSSSNASTAADATGG